MAERLKVGEALQRWLRGDSKTQSGRLTFQLEMVYSVKHGKRYGPYGPYWYVYWQTPLGHLRPSNRSRQRSRYVGKPDQVDPANMKEAHLRALIMPKQEALTGIETLGVPRWKIAAQQKAPPGPFEARKKKKRRR